MKRFLAALAFLANILVATAVAAAPICSTTQPCPNSQASGNRPVVCLNVTTVTTCGPFTPYTGRGANVSNWGTFTGSFVLERSFDGANWLPITAAGTPLYQWTAPMSEQFQEDEWPVQYRVRIISITGAMNIRISQ